MLRCFIDKIGELIWSDGYGLVRKAIEMESGKTVGIKSISIETAKKRKIGKKEEDNYRKLKGSSPYISDVIDIFEEV
jgi:serine/threonine protein kinase